MEYKTIFHIKEGSQWRDRRSKQDKQKAKRMLDDNPDFMSNYFNGKQNKHANQKEDYSNVLKT